MTGNEKKDPITDIIGNIGKWQWMIILPLAFREIFTSWQMLSLSFLAKEPANYYCQEDGFDRFANLENWQKFANVIDENGQIDKCLVYDLDYQSLSENDLRANASDLTNGTRSCEKWIFHENETNTLVTQVNVLITLTRTTT